MSKKRQFTLHFSATGFRLAAIVFAIMAIIVAITGYAVLYELAVNYNPNSETAISNQLLNSTAYLSAFGSFGVITVAVLFIITTFALLMYCFSLQARIKHLEEKMSEA